MRTVLVMQNKSRRRSRDQRLSKQLSLVWTRTGDESYVLRIVPFAMIDLIAVDTPVSPLIPILRL